jgi:hypothetical protein
LLATAVDALDNAGTSGGKAAGLRRLTFRSVVSLS